MNKDAVFDGNQSTTHSIDFATVNLNGTFIVSALDIHGKFLLSSYDPMSNIPDYLKCDIYTSFLFLLVSTGLTDKVHVKDNHNVTCYKGNIPRTATVYFRRVVKTNRLIIEFSKCLIVKEIEVYGGKF